MASCEDSDNNALSTKWAGCPAVAVHDVAGPVVKHRTDGATRARNKATASCKDSDDDARSTKWAGCPTLVVRDVVGTAIAAWLNMRSINR